MSETTDLDDAVEVPPRYRKAFIGGTIALVLVIAVALGYAWVRDPGPQPSVPPKISGTDNGGLKRAIIHYLGALESKKPAEIERLSGDAYDRTLVTFRAEAAVAEFGDSAQKPATVKITGDGVSGAVKYAAITFEDGRTQNVVFSTNDKDSWRPLPQTERQDPAPASPTGIPTPSASAAS